MLVDLEGLGLGVSGLSNEIGVQSFRVTILGLSGVANQAKGRRFGVLGIKGPWVQGFEDVKIPAE